MLVNHTVHERVIVVGNLVRVLIPVYHILSLTTMLVNHTVHERMIVVNSLVRVLIPVYHILSLTIMLVITRCMAANDSR